ncbi:hypothetical protein p13 [Rose leaf rosette-associated virus]|uniref:Uncharacterized protein n=1 Tax=Rose leaf rosette-associated virus TaxID=1543207 RepID=A0A088MGX9_9CLOS|nr:hypothetical protein p13 [Rose leaf rosette-associated virus]AIN39546.1 hypothetical protein p13 [Rose leaf rosette-associated virus]
MVLVKSIAFSSSEIEAMGCYGIYMRLTPRNGVYYIFRKNGDGLSIRYVTVTKPSTEWVKREGDDTPLTGERFLMSLLVDPEEEEVKLVVDSTTETYTAKLPLLPDSSICFNCEIPAFIAD